MYIFTYNNISAIISYPLELNKHTGPFLLTQRLISGPLLIVQTTLPHQKKKKVIVYAELSDTFNTIHYLELKWV